MTLSGGGARILVVDDELAIRRALRTNLARHDYKVSEAETGQEGLFQHNAFKPDIIVLDLTLPDIDGLEVIRQLRLHSHTPVIVLSVRGGEQEKILALDLGADDYLTKPFSVNELLARIRVALRHISPATAGGVFRTGDLEVDPERRIVRVAGKPVDLSPTEYELLKTLVSHADRVMTQSMLVQAVWGADRVNELHYLHVYVARLRRKIEGDAQRQRYIKTEPGVGYRLVATEDFGSAGGAE